MFRKTLIGICLLIVIYLLAMPVPVEPVAWQSPPNPGYEGVFAVNHRLKDIEKLSIGEAHSPEDMAVDSIGRIYAPTNNGTILRLQPGGSNFEEWVNTGGSPFGMEFNPQGDLIVVDIDKGLISINPEGKITVLTNEVDGTPILFPDDVDVAKNGKIYFSDASSKFIPGENGGAWAASQLDLLEHGKTGRVLMYDPETAKTSILMSNLNFANGVAVSHDQKSVLVSETGEYKIHRYWLDGPKKGSSEQFSPILPSFPDNISAGLNGIYWVALVSPRSKALDFLSDKPFLRKVIQRLPEFIKIGAQPYGHIIALNEEGEVVKDLQDPDGDYPNITSITETEDYLYLGNMLSSTLARLPKEKTGF